MLFMDEKEKDDGWAAFPSAKLASETYAADLKHQQLKQQQQHQFYQLYQQHWSGGYPQYQQQQQQRQQHQQEQHQPAWGHAHASPDSIPVSTAVPSGSDSHHGHQHGMHMGLPQQGWPSAGHHGPAAPSDHDYMADYGFHQGADGDGPSPHHAPSAPPLDTLVGTAHGGRGSSGGGAGAGGGALGQHRAVLDLDPPQWLPDSYAAACGACHSAFRPFVRLRHHCRMCGRIFCHACCHERMLLPPKFGQRDPQRVCEMCSTLLAPVQPYLAGTQARAAQPPVLDALDAVSLRSWLNPPWSTALEEEIFKGANLVRTFTRASRAHPERGLPTSVLQGARGLALLSVLRLGAGWSATFGTGVIVSRGPDGSWSAPCAVAATGVGWGLQLGGELTDLMLVLPTDEAVEAFCSGVHVSLGGNAAVAVGPLGRHADAAVMVGRALSPATAYSYSCSRGAFVGVAVEGSVMMVRQDVNARFYGRSVTAQQLLLDRSVPPPPGAATLYDALHALTHKFENRGRLVHRAQAAQQQQPLALPAAPASGQLLLPDQRQQRQDRDQRQRNAAGAAGAAGEDSEADDNADGFVACEVPGHEALSHDGDDSDASSESDAADVDDEERDSVGASHQQHHQQRRGSGGGASPFVDLGATTIITGSGGSSSAAGGLYPPVPAAPSSNDSSSHHYGSSYAFSGSYEASHASRPQAGGAIFLSHGSHGSSATHAIANDSAHASSSGGSGGGGFSAFGAHAAAFSGWGQLQQHQQQYGGCSVSAAAGAAPTIGAFKPSATPAAAVAAGGYKGDEGSGSYMRDLFDDYDY